MIHIMPHFNKVVFDKRILTISGKGVLDAEKQ